MFLKTMEHLDEYTPSEGKKETYNIEGRERARNKILLIY